MQNTCGKAFMEAVRRENLQALSAMEDVVQTINDQLDNIVHANLNAIKAIRFLALSTKQPSQLEEFAALQSKNIKRQAESVSVR